MNSKLAIVSERLGDERGKKVIFLSHCILNENTRYLGGAFARGAVAGLVGDIVQRGFGIVQMPCPEQLIWGGVLKRYLWFSLRSKSFLTRILKKLCYLLFIAYTRHAYRRLAKKVAREMADYQRNGFEIIGAVGVDGSPSCGVQTTLDMRKSFDYFSSVEPEALNREDMNLKLYRDCLVEGRGIFTQALEAACNRKGVRLRTLSHDLVAEWRGTAADKLQI